MGNLSSHPYTWNYVLPGSQCDPQTANDKERVSQWLKCKNKAVYTYTKNKTLHEL